MTAQIIQFPKKLTGSPPKTELQNRFDRIAELLMVRLEREDKHYSEEKVRAAITSAYNNVFGK